MTPQHIEFPVLGAKWWIGFTGLLHVSVASLAIGFAFVVTTAQIVGYLRRDRAYDLLAKRIQLYHVCIYNIGTIVAIGLIFGLSGLYPQFWSQLFVHQFWTLIIEEFLFLLLATTLTIHYFFWDYLWGHKKLHIFLGALLNPLFLLQFWMINGIGSFMLTPGAEEAQIDLARGIVGYDKTAFYNPSFLMLTLHRAFANVSYGGFFVAGICGFFLWRARPGELREAFEKGGRLAFYVGFAALLSLPMVGYFYSHVLKYHANEAFVNLMWGKGDVVAGGIDWWWVKQICVASLLGLGLGYFFQTRRDEGPFSVPNVLVVTVALFYGMFYLAMGMIMTWAFFWWMLAVGAGAWALARHLIRYRQGSPRSLYVLAGVLSAATVLLGGYAREASRPRFVDRYSHYDHVYLPSQRQPYLMVDVRPEDLPPLPERIEEPAEAVFLIRQNCIGCHTLERVRNYRLDNWRLVVDQMRAYGLRLTEEQTRVIVEHLRSGEPY
ncbi:MAG: cytochrome ubiquinol oxidase subunit I [Deferrisomatales bacterium]|nr:cytochrome ubiquinol oxidase subunit I [Deferrisomatales bacterium]